MFARTVEACAAASCTAPVRQGFPIPLLLAFEHDAHDAFALHLTFLYSFVFSTALLLVSVFLPLFLPLAAPFRSSFRPDSGLVRVHFGPSPRQRPLTRSLLRVASSRCLGASVPRLRPSIFGSLAVLSIVSRNINNNSYGAQQGFQQPAQQNSGSYNGQGY